MQVRFVGLRDLTQEEASLLSTLVEGYKLRLERDIPDFILVVSVKKHSKKAKQKYSIHTKLSAPSAVLVSQAFDWDFSRTIHKAMKKLENELQHKFKIEGHLPKPK